MKKTSLRDAILAQLHLELTRQRNAADTARDEAISTESQPENKWDTHSQEAAYLAEGQARLAGEVGESIELYSTLALPDFAPGDPIALGALVELEAPSAGKRRTTWYFIGPRAGGLEVSLDRRTILVLTPQSPLGRQLIGRRVGDVVPSTIRGAVVEQRITAVE